MHVVGEEGGTVVAYYSVIHYVPDPIADERINIGVLAFNEHRVLARFSGDWGRVQHFGGEDIAFLREFAHDVQDAIGEQAQILPDAHRVDEAFIRKMALEWGGSIQVSEPRPSMRGVDSLLTEASELMLRPRTPVRQEGRSRGDAVRLVLTSLEQAVILHLGAKAKQLVKPYWTLKGETMRHRLDAVLLNGSAYAAMDAISFETQRADDLRKEVGDIAWSSLDIRRLYPNLPFAVLALPPKRPTEAYQDLQAAAKSLKIDVLEEAGLEDWTAKAVHRIPGNVLAAYSGEMTTAEADRER